MPKHNDQNMLHDITQEARRLLETFSPPRTSSRSQHKLSSHHYLTLHLPSPITSYLISRGLDTPTAETLNQIYLDKAASLKQAYENQHFSVITRCLDVDALRVHDIDRFISATHSACIARYDRSLRDWQAKIDEIHRSGRSLPADVRSMVTPATIEKRRTFKNESVPILEKKFHLNAYPSRVDKESLAEEIGMEYKQVTIWFQNRRARAKKEGNSLQRTTTFVTQLHTYRSVSVSSSLASAVASGYGEERSTHSSKICVSRDLLKRSEDSLTSTAKPTYTFPTPYPPLFDEDPFPTRGGAGSFQIPWIRKCSPNTIQTSMVDIDHLTSQMAKLSLSSDPSSRYMNPIPSFKFILPRAPIPALIRTATAPSRARPVPSFTMAAGLSGSKESRNPYRALPTRLSVERRAHSPPLFPRSLAIPIPSRSSAAERTRRTESRSPSPPHSSRSSSLSSNISSRSTSSTWSVASSAGPATPPSTSRIEALSFSKDMSPSFTAAYTHRLPSISDDDHVSSSLH